MTALSTPAEMLHTAAMFMCAAAAKLADARDELKSDWPPGHEMTDEQAARRTRMFKAIDEAKAAIEEGLR
jgi:hypothetical protein